jgi:hypothetical protein
VLEYPGLACKHCANKNNTGRYFPVSAKNLTDNTANSLMSHVSTCSRCPENIKASIAYLSHRAILQKAELSGSWKKSFFKKIWDRLHIEREWVDALTEDTDEAGSLSSDEANDAQAQGEDTKAAPAAAVPEEGDESESGDEKKPVGNSMNALIKAAAIWLTKDDQTKEGGSGTRSSRGRTLPGKKRTAEKSPTRGKKNDEDDEGDDTGGRGSGGKRRRVHF